MGRTRTAATDRSSNATAAATANANSNSSAWKQKSVASALEFGNDQAMNPKTTTSASGHNKNTNPRKRKWEDIPTFSQIELDEAGDMDDDVDVHSEMDLFRSLLEKQNATRVQKMQRRFERLMIALFTQINNAITQFSDTTVANATSAKQREQRLLKSIVQEESTIQATLVEAMDRAMVEMESIYRDYIRLMKEVHVLVQEVESEKEDKNKEASQQLSDQCKQLISFIESEFSKLDEILKPPISATEFAHMHSLMS